MQPSSQPTGYPSGQPSSQPSEQPSGQPSSQPSAQPSSQPTSEPTQPTGQPTGQPSAQPSSQPSSQPTNPTSHPTALYYQFNAYEAYTEYISQTDRGISSDLKFGIAAQKEEDYRGFHDKWDTFVDTELNVPFEMNFYEFGLYTSLATYDCL